MSKHILLQAWAAIHFDPPPSMRTVRAWAAAAQINPAPFKVGAKWYVDEDARYDPPKPSPVARLATTATGMSPRAVHILQRTG